MNELLKFIRCPDSGTKLRFHMIDEQEYKSGILESDNFGFIYPVIDGIPIIFPLTKKNINQELLYFNLLLDKKPNSEIKKKINNYTYKLKSINNDNSWEWDDVDFWDKIYHKNWVKLIAGDDSFYQKQLPEREFQRRKDFKFIIENDIPDGPIVEIGAGSAIYTKTIIDKYINNIYISCDMSISALRIRRKLLQNKNSYHIVCPISNLPLKKNCISLALLLGILHHTEHKEHTLPYLKKMLQNKGVLYIDEVLHRPSFLPHRNLKKGLNVSAHEEYIFLDGLKFNLNENGKVKYYKIFHTPFYNLIKNLFPPLIRKSYRTYELIMFIDKIFMKTLGYLSNRFKPGAITIIWEKE